jgi:predicted Mrr-cat superfamily restriction endonuclease
MLVEVGPRVACLGGWDLAGLLGSSPCGLWVLALGVTLLRRSRSAIFATDTYSDGGPDFFKSDLVAIDFHSFVDLRTLPADPRDVRAELMERVPEWRPGTATMAARQLHQVANEMDIGDAVVTPTAHGRSASVGIIVGEYDYVDGRPGFRHVRAVRWVAHRIDRHALSTDSHRELSQRPTVFPLSVAPRELVRHL